MSIEVVLLRHAERVDETTERDEWAQSCGDRYWDPPITERGLRQSREAGQALLGEHIRRPFSCVYVSPCLRTVQTAAEVAQVLGLPLRCSPGLAECAAAVKREGIASFRCVTAANGWAVGADAALTAMAQAAHRQLLEPSRRSRSSRPTLRFLTESELAVHCPDRTRFLAREDTYEGFFACAARLAAAEHHAQTRHTTGAAAAADAADAADSDATLVPAVSTGVAAAPSLRVLMVTHREGIRDLCELAGAPHRRTPYCCTAVYAFDTTPPVPGASGASSWRLLSPPSAQPGQIAPLLGSIEVGPAPPDAAPVHSSTDVLLAELGAGRLAAAEFVQLGLEAGMPEAVVADVLIPQRVQSLSRR